MLMHIFVNERRVTKRVLIVKPEGKRGSEERRGGGWTEWRPI